MPRSSSRGQTASALPLVVAPSLVREGWAGIVTSINSWGKQHVGWALCIDQNIAKVIPPHFFVLLNYACHNLPVYLVHIILVYSVFERGADCCAMRVHPTQQY